MATAISTAAAEQTTAWIEPRTVRVKIEHVCDRIQSASASPSSSPSSSVVEYEIRGLRDEEVPGWARFCASVFAYKAHPPSPSYFERHFYNDPRKDASLIRVAFHGDRMVSSCRIFRRTVACASVSDQSEAGGIGEVCTDPDHRRRGLSKLLLHDAIKIMKSLGMRVSMLHAAPAFFPVYQRGGKYENVVSRWSDIRVPIGRDGTTATATATATATTLMDSFTLRPAEFPRDTERLQCLHQEFSEKRFFGCIIRSAQYWNDYISKELSENLWVATRIADTNGQKIQDVVVNSSNSNSNISDDRSGCTDGDIVAWLSLRPRGPRRYQIREFGIDLETITSTTTKAALLSRLVHTALRDEGPTTDGSAKENGRSVILNLPTSLLQDEIGLETDLIKNRKSDLLHDWEFVGNADDEGWMYRSLDGSALPIPTKPHLIWPTDAF